MEDDEKLWETGKSVIMDSSFYVLRGLMGMFERGVYGSALVKKRSYRPTGIYGGGINAHCKKR